MGAGCGTEQHEYVDDRMQIDMNIGYDDVGVHSNFQYHSSKIDDNESIQLTMYDKFVREALYPLYLIKFNDFNDYLDKLKGHQAFGAKSIFHDNHGSVVDYVAFSDFQEYFQKQIHFCTWFKDRDSYFRKILLMDSIFLVELTESQVMTTDPIETLKHMRTSSDQILQKKATMSPKQLTKKAPTIKEGQVGFRKLITLMKKNIDLKQPQKAKSQDLQNMKIQSDDLSSLISSDNVSDNSAQKELPVLKKMVTVSQAKKNELAKVKIDGIEKIDEKEEDSDESIDLESQFRKQDEESEQHAKEMQDMDNKFHLVSESDSHYDVEMLAIRILGLLICRGEVRDKATYLFGMLVHDFDPIHNEHLLVSWTNQRLLTTLKLLIYFSQILPLKFIVQHRDEPIFKRMFWHGRPQLKKDFQMKKDDEDLQKSVKAMLEANDKEFTQDFVEEIGSFTEKYFEDIVEEYLVDRIFKDFATTLNKEKFIEGIAGEVKMFGDFFGGGDDQEGDITKGPMKWLFSTEKIRSIIARKKDEIAKLSQPQQ